ncbi:hypothetical protein [Kitasatospora acidiphila]|nr:hypothetical protein [Kitasatospora acidiphila]
MSEVDPSAGDEDVQVYGITETGTDSYRLASTRARTETPAKAS